MSFEIKRIKLNANEERLCKMNNNSRRKVLNAAKLDIVLFITVTLEQIFRNFAAQRYIILTIGRCLFHWLIKHDHLNQISRTQA